MSGSCIWGGAGGGAVQHPATPCSAFTHHTLCWQWRTLKGAVLVCAAQGGVLSLPEHNVLEAWPSVMLDRACMHVCIYKAWIHVHMYIHVCILCVYACMYAYTHTHRHVSFICNTMSACNTRLTWCYITWN
jgi:hypothetical protein